MRRVYKFALRDMDFLLGPYVAALVYCELRASIESEQGRVELERRGVQMVGGAA